MAIKAISDEDTVITAELVNGLHGPVTIWDVSDPEADGIFVGYVFDKEVEKLKLVATRDDESKTIEYDLSGLTLEPAPEVEE